MFLPDLMASGSFSMVANIRKQTNGTQNASVYYSYWWYEKATNYQQDAHGEQYVKCLHTLLILKA